MAQFKIADFYLDIKEIEKLNIENIQIINNYYDTLVSGGHGRIAKDGLNSIFETLIRSGYLKSISQEEREEKIKQVLS